jgi:uncharacterized protein
MSTDGNVALVKKIYELFAKGDIKTLLAQFSGDIRWHTPGYPNVPYAGDFFGREHVAKFFDGLGKTAEMERFEPQDFIAQGDRVVVLGHYSGRGKKTGRPFSTDWVMVFTVKNGKAVQFHEYFDTQNLGSAFSPAMAHA